MRRAAALLACIVLMRASCQSDVRKIPTGVGGKGAAETADELKDKERRAFTVRAQAEYPSYKNLYVGFTLKGKINNEELYYEGELNGGTENLKITLKDAVFLSPLLTLDIGKVTVTLKDHARNKSESIPRKDYEWVELFGRSFPVRFFEPLMRGYLPADASSTESQYARTAAGDTLVRTDSNTFEAAMYFSEFKLKKIFYRDKLRGEILIFQLMQFFPKRNYPRVLRIEHSRTNDYLTLTFKNLSVK